MAAIDDDEFLKRTVESARNGRQYFYDFFTRLGIQYIESQANFVTIVLDSEKLVDHIYTQLLQRGVIIRPLKSFGMSNCIRITTGLEEENKIFSENFEQIFNSV